MLKNRLSNKKSLKIFAILLTLGAFGCASVQEDKSLPPEELYKQGVEQFYKRNYKKAERIFERILNEFPNSRVRIVALMALAISQYRIGDYEGAKFHFEKFIEQFPANPKVDKAYYFKAMCSFKQMESYERDQTNTQLALEAFENVITTYPGRKYAKLAREKKKICRKRLAMHLLYIGKYYFRIGAYQSVIDRMNEMLEDYPKQKFLDEAIFLLGESYLKEGNRKKAYFAFKNLIKKFPNSKFKADARNKLASLK